MWSEVRFAPGRWARAVGFGLGAMLCACTADPGAVGPVTPKWPGNPGPAISYSAGGVAMTVTVAAADGHNDPAPGATLALSTTQAGVAFVPPTVITNEKGLATSTVLVPFGASVEATATAPDGTIAQTTLTASPPLILVATVTATQPTATGQGPGQLVTVRAVATSLGGPAVGTPLSFTTNSAGIAFSPPSVTTDDLGAASATAFVPYGPGEVLAFVSGGGATLPVSLTDSLAGVQLGALGISRADKPGGTLLTVVAQAMAGNAPIDGLAISFATSAASVVFSPATALTDGSGEASSSVFIPYGAATWISASGGGATQLLLLGEPNVPAPVLTVETPDPLTTSSFAVTVCASEPGHGALAGAELVFSVPGSSDGAAPGTAITGASGCATTSIQLPGGAVSGTFSVSFDGVTGCYELPGGQPCE